MTAPSKLVPLVALAAGLTACTIESEPSVVSEDPPAGWSRIHAPNDFGDVATTCLDGVRLFIGQDDVKAASAIAAVADPTCEVER